MPLASIQPQIKFTNQLIPTKKEAQILRGYAFGMAPNEIATSMDISAVNIGQCIANLYEKWHALERTRRGEAPYFVEPAKGVLVRKDVAPKVGGLELTKESTNFIIRDRSSWKEVLGQL